MKFCRFTAYVRTRSAGILRGLTPWHTDFGTKSSVLHLVRGVQAPGTHVRSDYSQTRHIGGRPSSHKANLIPQSKRQDTTVIVIPCLCSFNALCSPSAEFPINKKRTRTLFHKESGSSTNCMVENSGIEPLTSCMPCKRSPERYRNTPPHESVGAGLISRCYVLSTKKVHSCILLPGIMLRLQGNFTTQFLSVSMGFAQREGHLREKFFLTAYLAQF